MRKHVIVSFAFAALFLLPIVAPTGYPSTEGTTDSVEEKSSSIEWADLPDGYTGSGGSLAVTMSGTVANSYDSSFVIDSYNLGTTTVPLSSGWTADNLVTTIPGMSVWMSDDLENGNLDKYHSEKWLVSSYQDEDVLIPDTWSLTKVAPSDYSEHPHHGYWELNSYSGAGNGGTMGWEFEVEWDSGSSIASTDEIFLSQYVLAPYRDIYSAQVTFSYNVSSASSMTNQAHLFVRLAGYETKLLVFESGDTTDTWNQTVVTIPSGYLDTISMPNSLLLDIGLATDRSGVQSALELAYVLLDDIQVSLEVRPFPEQISLKANGVPVVGTAAGRMYSYIQDDVSPTSYDCYSESSTGIDLDGYGNDGYLSVGAWGSNWSDMVDFQVGLQFQLNIPRGAAIANAYLEVYPSSTQDTSAMKIRVAGKTSGGGAVTAFTTGLPSLEDGYSWLATGIDWTPIRWITEGDVSTNGYQIIQRTPDFASLIQSVVSDTTWSSGRYVCLMLDYMYSTTYQSYSELTGTTYFSAPQVSRLMVEYAVPLPEDQVYSFLHEKDLTIDHTKVAGNLTDFPVLVDITDTDLKNDAQADADDVAFSIGDVGLDHETEYYDSSTGRLVAWVKVPYLSSITDTVITMHYGNPYAQRVTSRSVWNDYSYVGHMHTSPAGTVYDSAAGDHHGTSYGTMDGSDLVSAKLDSGIDFDGTDDRISIGQIDTDDWTQFTASAWVYHDASADDRILAKAFSIYASSTIMSTQVASTTYRVRLWTDGTNGLAASHDFGTVSITAWHLMTWSWSASTAQIVAYLDGVQLGAAQAHDGDTVRDSVEMFVIGDNSIATTSSQWKAWDGKVDEVRLTTNVLTAAWISTEYANQNSPSTFMSVGIERDNPTVWSDNEIASMTFSTTSVSPVSMDIIVTMDLSGTGATLDENLVEGTTFHAVNASIIDWTAKILVSPPSGTGSLQLEVAFPQTEWKPVSLTNPVGDAKTYGTEWWYEGSTVVIPESANDAFGVWTLKFVSMNYILSSDLGPSGGPYSSTANFSIDDTAQFRASVPLITSARTVFALTEPSGNTWHTDYHTSTGTPAHVLPSFSYRRVITVLGTQIAATVTDFPMVVDIQTASFYNGQKVQTDGDDIVFVKDGKILAHDVVLFNPNSGTGLGRLVAWIKVNLTASTDYSFDMYYGSPVVGAQENPKAVWTNNYEAVWHLDEVNTDEQTTGVHYDSTGNDYFGNQNGNYYTSTTAVAANAQQYDGVNDWIKISSTRGLAASSDVVVSGWFRLPTAFSSSSTTSRLLFEKFLSTSYNMHIALVGTDYTSTPPDGSLVFKVETGAGVFRYKYTTSTTWSANTWYYFVCYMDADNLLGNKIYINNADATNTGEVGSATTGSLGYSADWGIGGGYIEEISSGQAWLSGIMDEVRVSTGSRTLGWIQTEYNNQKVGGPLPNGFFTLGSEQQRTDVTATITKAIDSTASAGLWTVSAHYNDTGTGVSHRTGFYERQFVVKHATSLSIRSPGDASGDGITAKLAGEMLYVEVKLTDTVDSSPVADASVKLNWSVGGSPTTKALNDYGTGYYGLGLNTSDLGTAQRWALNIWSYHDYYLSSSIYLYVDLSHTTELTYASVTTTPWGFDLTATLVYRDSYTGLPISGASIAFANGTPVTPVAQGNGMYNISLDSDGLSVGDHILTFRASKPSSYMTSADADVTFTLRAHYTAVSVTGDLTSPYGWKTPVTVVLIDADTGTQIAAANVASLGFTWSGGSYTKTSPSSYLFTLPTNTWILGTKTVTLAVSMSNANYYAPDNHVFGVIIRQHYTSASVTGDLLTPYGFSTSLTIFLIDTDNGTVLTSSSVSSFTFTSAGYTPYTESSPGDLSVDLPTTAWTVAAHSTTLSMVLAGNYNNPSNYVFNIQIRNHHTSASVQGDLLTPYGFTTALTILITDLDTGGTLTSSSVSSFTFTSTGYTPYTESSPTDLSVDLTTTTWTVGAHSTTLSMVLTGNYNNPSNYVFNVQIRNHYTSMTVQGDLVTPYGFVTTLTIIIRDLDTGGTLAASSVSTFTFTSTGYTPYTETSPGDLNVDLPTTTWTVGAHSTTLSMVLTGNYNNPSNYVFDVQIRNHYTSVTVIGNMVQPQGFVTPLTIVITDKDTGGTLTSSSVSSFTFTSAGYSPYTESSPGDLIVDLTTTTWTVGAHSTTLSMVLTGTYDNPSNYIFNIQIRNHYTSATVTGSLTAPYGNSTSVKVVITDTDTLAVLSVSSVTSLSFTTSGYAPYNEVPPVGDLDVPLPTGTWSIGAHTVTLSVTMGGIYNDPANYDFTLTIVALTTQLYHEPNDLVFPNGNDFWVVLRINISQHGPHYGEAVVGEIQSHFSAMNSSYTYPITVAEIGAGTGRYNLTIAASHFPEGYYTITVIFSPTNTSLKSSTVEIPFRYRPAASELSSPDRATVTPYDTDFVVTLTYIDTDRVLGIAGATITPSGITVYGRQYLGAGVYRVTVDVSGLNKGEHLYNLTVDKAGYESQTLSFKVVIRIAYTTAIPTVSALDIPVGNDPVFYVEYRDIDHNLPITSDSPFMLQTNWVRAVIWQYIASEQRYRVTFPTDVNDLLEQNRIVTFNFSKGENYQFGVFNLTVTIRTHNTDFRLVSAVEPTSYNNNITINVFYGDLDDQVGIASRFVVYRVENATHIVASWMFNSTSQGTGYYLIYIPAAQFNSLGLMTFTIYFNWTGSVSTYYNRILTVAANIVGEDSRYTLIVTSEPTPYLENMSYVFFYSDLAGNGIRNNTGNVHVSVSFRGQTVDLSYVDIWETNPSGQWGNYSIRFNTTLLAQIGLVYMDVFVNWTKGVSPFYSNRADVISVRIIARDTLVSVVPPSSTPYGENATFTFTFDDVTGAASMAVAYQPTRMAVLLSLADYSVSYNSVTRVLTVSFDTSQFGAPLGSRSFTLGVEWVGTPFYANRTGRSISVTVTVRETTLDYQTPSPTQYLDNFTVTIAWADVTGGSRVGIDSGTLTLYDGATPIPSSYYSVTSVGDGNYTVVFNSTYYSNPGTYSLTARLTNSSFFMPLVSAIREFNVRYRLTLVASEPPERVPYGGELSIVLTYRDLYTLDVIGNDTGVIQILVLNPGVWNYSCEWQPSFGRYVLTVQTGDQPGLTIGTPYVLHIQMSYPNLAPFYSTDDSYVTFEIRSRNSALEMYEFPVPTPYNDYSSFKLLFRDTDFNGRIDNADIRVYKGVTLLVQGTDYTLTREGSGTYGLSVLTSVLDGLGTTRIRVWADWTLGAPFYGNAALPIDLVVVQRPTIVEIVVTPTQTRFLENVTFVIAYLDIGTSSGITLNKNLVRVYNGYTQLSSADFSLTRQGLTFNYEVSIESDLLDSVLISNRNLTVLVDYANVVPYYADDSASVRVTVIQRETFLSISRPGDTAFGENATFAFVFYDTTTGLSVPIGQSSQMTIVSSLAEVPRLSYNTGTKIFTMYFNTSQFGSIGLKSFYLNITWIGMPFYGNATFGSVIVQIMMRQTQVEFQTPDPTPFGDTATFDVSYIDVAGASNIGIPDATLTLYYSGSPVNPAYYSASPDGLGTWTVSFDTGFFSEPGSYVLTASFVYSGSYYRADASAARSMLVRFRLTTLSSDPVGLIGYGTTMEIVLTYQDQLTLVNIGNTTYLTTLTLLNDTGTPWVYTIQWRPASGSYLLRVETAGQPISLGADYTLHLNMSYQYVSPYYRWDDAYVQFSIRSRASALDVQDSPIPTPFLEPAEFTVYYWDVDATQGITGASFTIANESGLLDPLSYVVTPGVSPGLYHIHVNTSALVSLGSHSITVTALWGGGVPYHNNAAKNITVTVSRRPANVEIISPPSSTRFLDNMTFTFTYLDSVTGQVIPLTASNLRIYSGGVLLESYQFMMVQVGSLFEVSINSTVLGSTLVSNLNITILADWNDIDYPYYIDDITSLRVSTTGRSMFVEVGPIETTPIADNMTISFSVSDDDTGSPVENAVILFDCTTVPGQMVENTSYWLVRGAGADVGLYTIIVDTQWLLTTGDFVFSLGVRWAHASAPFYSNRSAISLRGSVDLIWALLQSDLPQPMSVQITDSVYVIVYYTDNDHGGVGVEAAGFDVRYLDSGIVPSGLSVVEISSGVYNISFSTEDLEDFGPKTLSITAFSTRYTPSTVQPNFVVGLIQTTLSVQIPTIQLSWTDIALVEIDFKDLLHENLTADATLTYVWAGRNGTLSEYPGYRGRYYVALNTSLADAGTWVVTITASKTRYTDAVSTVTLIVLTLPTKLELALPVTVTSSTDRGAPLTATVFIRDLYNDVPVRDKYVNNVTAELKVNATTSIRHDMVYNGTLGYYTCVFSSDDMLLNIGPYDIIVTVTLRNYNPATTLFTVTIKQTPTSLEREPTAPDEIVAVYTEIVQIDLWLKNNITDAIIAEATVTWTIAGTTKTGNFTHVSGGRYQTFIDTREIGYGIHPLIFRAKPVDNKLASSFNSTTLSVSKIETNAVRPDQFYRFWGWAGLVTFGYHDISFDLPIPNATATTFLDGNAADLGVIDIGNGNYTVFLNTSLLVPGNHRIRIEFRLINYQEASAELLFTVNSVPTSLAVTYPDVNWVSNTPQLTLQVPIGDTVSLVFFYNDTDGSDSYIGGLQAASTITSNVFGTYRPIAQTIMVEELGGGYYRYVFDSRNPDLFATTNGVPTVDSRYTLMMILDLGNRTSQRMEVVIDIIPVPAAYEIMRQDLSLEYGQTGQLVVRYYDTWPTHENRSISGANFTVRVEPSSGFLVVFADPYEDITNPGTYIFEYQAAAILIGQSSGTDTVELVLKAENTQSLEVTLQVTVGPSQSAETLYTAFIWGTPLGIIGMLLLTLYIKVLSVPKRLRQINKQIKTIKKGRVPKPISDVKSREQILAELFNDTYKDLGIVRAPEQMPVESVVVDIPEMGELLMQLTILTRLNPTELDEFKADISKMRVSEQAAFVKEVIMQEALRTARRENRPLDQVMKAISEQAKARLGEERGFAAPSEVMPEEEPVILRPEEKPAEIMPPAPREEKPVKGAPKEPGAPKPTVTDKLSQYELEELRKNLKAKGVPAHEIDTIIEQAKELPRELVEELVRSLTK